MLKPEDSWSWVLGATSVNFDLFGWLNSSSHAKAVCKFALLKRIWVQQMNSPITLPWLNCWAQQSHQTLKRPWSLTPFFCPPRRQRETPQGWGLYSATENSVSHSAKFGALFASVQPSLKVCKRARCQNTSIMSQMSQMPLPHHPNCWCWNGPESTHAGFPRSIVSISREGRQKSFISHGECNQSFCKEHVRRLPRQWKLHGILQKGTL